GLYAEVIKRDGLVEDIQNKHRVVVCGPTTIAALLNSLQMGFRSVAIEKRSTEIGKLLQSFLVDFAKFSKLLQQTGDKLTGVQTTLANAEKRTDYIRQKLDKVSRITGEEAPSLPVDIGEVSFDSDDEDLV
ncbi:MAG: DNA recombination protein RmuC, partial [Clostridia bacterium]|nr:DNA recombination protein RmuC [Clostridia bacterium]